MAFPIMGAIGMGASIGGGAAGSVAGGRATRAGAQQGLENTQAQIAMQNWIAAQQEKRLRPFYQQGIDALPELEARRMGQYDVMSSPYAAERAGMLNSGMSRQLALRGQSGGTMDQGQWDALSGKLGGYNSALNTSGRDYASAEEERKRLSAERAQLAGAKYGSQNLSFLNNKTLNNIRAVMAVTNAAPDLDWLPGAKRITGGGRDKDHSQETAYYLARQKAIDDYDRQINALSGQMTTAQQRQGEYRGLADATAQERLAMLGQMGGGPAAYGMQNALQNLRSSEEGLGYERAIDRVRIGQGNAANAGQQYGQYANALSGAYQSAGNINSALAQSLGQQRQQMYGDAMNTAAGFPAMNYLYNKRRQDVNMERDRDYFSDASNAPTRGY